MKLTLERDTFGYGFQFHKGAIRTQNSRFHRMLKYISIP